MFDLENWNWYPKWNLHVLFDPKIIWVIQPFILEVKIQWPQLVCFRKITIWKNKCGYWYWQILSKNLHSWQFLVNFFQMIDNKSSLSLLDGFVVADRWPVFIAGWPDWRTDLELTQELTQQLKIGKYSTLFVFWNPSKCPIKYEHLWRSASPKWSLAVLPTQCWWITNFFMKDLYLTITTI